MKPNRIIKPKANILLIMMKMQRLLIGWLVLSSCWSVACAEVYRWLDATGRAHYSDRPGPGAESIALNPGYAFTHIKQVYDGDTVLLADGRKIRLLGINTPEIEGRNKTEEAGGEEAKRWLNDKFNGTRIRLVHDVEQQDKYGRTLAHLFTERKQHINLELVREGLATVNIYPPNLQYAQALISAQNEAEAAGRGIWSRPEYAPKPVDQITHKNYKGWQRLTGHPLGIHQTRKFVYLKFGDRFDARIERKNSALFPDLSDYIGKTLELRGWLNRSKGRFSMLIRHPSAVKILTDQ
ncbi:MAG: thermonuclease family protein [Gammaproteobacteria bacterium]